MSKFLLMITPVIMAIAKDKYHKRIFNLNKFFSVVLQHYYSFPAVVVILITYIATTFLHINYVYASPFDNYPNLFENKSSSENYEIVKLVDNSIEAVLYHEKNQNIIISTGEYLGKINTKGELIDYYKTRSSFYSSGLDFGNDYYNDWILTGDKVEKPYDSKVDARGYSVEKLFKLFNKAEFVEFSTSNRNERKGYAHLYSKGNVLLVDISDKVESIQTRCDTYDRRWEDFGWKNVCFKSYKPNEKLIIIKNMLSWGRSSLSDVSDTQPPLTLIKFSKSKFTLDKGLAEESFNFLLAPLFGYRSQLPNAYWFGDAYFSLKHKEEIFRFKLFADNEGEHINHRNFSMYQAEAALFDDIKILVVNYRSSQHTESEVELNKYYEQDVGLYILRKKNTNTADIVKTRLVKWQPTYSGVASGKDIFGSYSFFDRQLNMQFYTLTKQGRGQNSLYRLPKTLSLDWHTKSPREKFILKLKGNKTAVYQHTTDKTKVSFAVGFNEEELRTAFSLITQGVNKAAIDEVIKLDVQFHELSTDAAQLKIGLASKKQFIELKNYSVMPIGNKKASKIDYSGLTGAYEMAREDIKKFNTLFSTVNLLSKEPNYTDTYLASVIYRFTLLINQYNKVKNFSASIELIEFYIEEVFPFLYLIKDNKGSVSNNAVITSQALIASIYKPDLEMQSLLFDTLLGDTFEMSQSENGALIYNLACFYALKGDKDNMLAATGIAISLGKLKGQFMKDSDFKAYYKDEEFLSLFDSSQ